MVIAGTCPLVGQSMPISCKQLWQQYSLSAAIPLLSS